MTEMEGFAERMEAVRKKMEAVDREEDVDAALALLEEAVEEVEALGRELEGER